MSWFRLPASIAKTCGAILLLAATASRADTVNVVVSGNVATATIAVDSVTLPARTFHAIVTITFDDVQNLTATSLGLTAFAVNPNDLGFLTRLPLGTSIDPDFPVIVRVEPPTHGLDWLYRAGFDGTDDWPADLSFRNGYTLEVHTTDLVFPLALTQQHYRLFKSPLGGAFDDYSDAVCEGSVRARDRDGGFSEFLMVRDTRSDYAVALGKSLDLRLRATTANLLPGVLGLLTGLLDQLDLDVTLANLGLVSLATPLADSEALLAQIAASTAAGNLPNVWRATHDVDNVSGNLAGRAASLRYSLRRFASAPEAMTCPSP